VRLPSAVRDVDVCFDARVLQASASTVDHGVARVNDGVSRKRSSPAGGAENRTRRRRFGDAYRSR
jgi:hypothetical protein